MPAHIFELRWCPLLQTVLASPFNQERMSVKPEEQLAVLFATGVSPKQMPVVFALITIAMAMSSSNPA
jgi:hypothetical protein